MTVDSVKVEVMMKRVSEVMKSNVQVSINELVKLLRALQ